MNLARCLSLADLETAARRRLPGAVFGFVHGGAEDGRSLRANREAFDDWALRPRGLTGVADRMLGVELFGRRHALPIGIAPMGVASIVQYECDRLLAGAAQAGRIPFVLSGVSNVPMETLAAQSPDFWYQGYLPGDTERIAPLLARLAQAGVRTLVVTIDTPVGANRENNVRAGFAIPFRPSARLVASGLVHPHWSIGVLARTLLRGGVPRFANQTEVIGTRITEDQPGGFRGGREALSWQHLDWLRGHWPGHLLIKGVLHPGDAELAVAYGLDGVIVSNHGGRQLDGAMASLRALPAIVRAVPATFPVLIDGGFRRGTDVIKALALGARMVLIGRPMLYGAAVGGQAGVARAISILATEIDRDLALLGCRQISDLTPDCLSRVAARAEPA